MYNDQMPIRAYEIRVCNACGLRYPVVEGHPFGTRCPVCAGETRIALSRELNGETGPRRSQKAERANTTAVLLDNIRSAWNVGSILRSADGFGFSHAYLCGITPTADKEAVTKTSLGAEDSVPWSYHKDAVRLVRGLKSEGWRVFALEDETRAIHINHSFNVSAGSRPAVLIVGNEVTGVDPELLDLCDQAFYIPMHGEKKSFNVAIAFGIAAYAFHSKKVES
ncbi:MAG TPA: RNA methyltransferase [Anaerolineales bacterium]